MKISADARDVGTSGQQQQGLPLSFSKRERPPISIDALRNSAATKTATATKENPDAD